MSGVTQESSRIPTSFSESEDNAEEESYGTHPNPETSHNSSDTARSSSTTLTHLGTLSRRLSLWQPKRRATVLAVIVATIGSFCLGNVLTFSAPVLRDDAFMKRFPDIGNGSWMATIALLGALLSAPVSGILIARIGRRKTMLLTAIPFTIGWATIAFAPNTATLYTGRFLTGFCGGAFTVAVPPYVSEVSEDRIRGTLAVSFIFMLCIGIEFTYVLGAYVDWFTLTVVCGCIPVVFFFSMLCMPESPRYLIQAQKPLAARNALKWLRRASTKRYIEPEISKIENSVNAATAAKKSDARFTELFTLRVLKPIGISAALMMFAQLSGMNGVSLYTVEIFEDAGTGIDARVVSIIIGATQAITVLVVPFILVEKMGRRSLLIISGLVMCVSLLALGTYFYLLESNNGKSPEGLSWLPLVSLLVITIGYNVGLGPIPWVITSEILPNDVKELASSCISIAYWTLSFVAGKTFQDVKDSVGYVGVYYPSAVVCFVGTLFVFFVVPETKGKSSEEIQRFFSTRKEVAAPSTSADYETSHTQSPEGVDNPAFVNQGGNIA